MPDYTRKTDALTRRGFRRGDVVWTPTLRRVVLTEYNKGSDRWGCRYENGEQGILNPRHIKLAE